ASRCSAGSSLLPAFLLRSYAALLLSHGRYWSLRGNYHTAGQCSMPPAPSSAARVVAPEDERVFHRIGVVVAPRAGSVKPKPLVQAPRARIPRAHFERRAPRPETFRFLEHVMHQRRPVAKTAELRPQRDVVDVDLVEHQPEGAESGDRTVRRAD